MSTTGAFHQLLAGFADGDAISREARLMRDAARDAGHTADIFVPADRIGTAVQCDCRPLTEFTATDEDTVLLHYSTRSSATQAFRDTSGRRIMRYHNITPASFFRGLDDAVVSELATAREELLETATMADAIWADSQFNADELRDGGVANVDVLPLFFSIDAFHTPPDPGTLARFSGDLKNLLFVGRIAPNKRLEDLLLAFAWLNKAIDPGTRLILVGSERSCPRYYAMLQMLATRLGLTHVCFSGFLSESQLSAAYQVADLFVCTSRHEGYCLPLLEAMSYGVPVLARRTGGMPEALDGAGVLYDGLAPNELAELFRRMLSDPALRHTVATSQEQRLTAIRSRNHSEELLARIAS